MVVMKIKVESRAYSISFVALKAMSMRDMRRNALFSKRSLSLAGISIALPAKRPWYKMMRENRMGCDWINDSAGPVMGLNRLDNIYIYIQKIKNVYRVG